MDIIQRYQLLPVRNAILLVVNVKDRQLLIVWLVVQAV